MPESFLRARFSRPSAARARRGPAHRCEALEPRVVLSGAGVAAATTFAVIGDYGMASGWDETVARTVKGWDPDLILTVGDNLYARGTVANYDNEVGRLYHDYIYNYRGAFGAGSATRRFLPAIGNHDWGEPHNVDGIDSYLSFFDLPGNERYYDFAAGSVHFFCLDSDLNEPDGVSPDSPQARWLRDGLAAAPEPWKVVYFHHAPFSSGLHHGDSHMRWPFRGWGASAVISGHDHDYERLNVGGLPYFVNGLGGAGRYVTAGSGRPVEPFSEVRYDAYHGAMLVEATEASMRFQFITASDGRVIDSYTLDRPATPDPALPAAPSALAARGASDARVDLSWADNSADESGFEIERSSDGGWRFDHLVTVDRDATAFIDRDVSAGRSYLYRVRAVNAAGASDYAAPGPVAARVLLTVPVLPAGSVWKYRDDGSDQGMAWRDADFDDSAWAAGPAKLGYGEWDVATPLSYGPDPNARHVTTYFRSAFAHPADPRPAAALRLRLLADDGAVVYLNGREAFRWNMPGGPVGYLTRAVGGLKQLEELQWHEADLPASLMRPGRNVLAVEVHQYSTTRFVHDEEDLAFDLELLAAVDATRPAAALAPPPPVVAGTADYTFDVIYTDDAGLGPVAPPLPAAGVVVTGPNGFNQAAALVRAAASPDGRTLTATYSIDAPGGAWDDSDAGVYAVSVLEGGAVTDTSGNAAAPGPVGAFAWRVALATVSGRIFDDADLDARRGAGEPPLDGWGVYVDGNANGVLDTGEHTAVTGADGVYVLAGLPPGRAVVRPVPRPAWMFTTAGDAWDVTLGEGQSSAGHDFSVTDKSAVPGFVFDDLNGDGYYAATDAPARGRTVYLDSDGDGAFDAGEPNVVTGADGTFRFARLPAGTYEVRQVLPAGWRHTAPGQAGVGVLKLRPGESAIWTWLAGAPVYGVVGRHVFYNHSAFDGRDPAANDGDDDAIAVDKSALLPGGTASFANVTSYSPGMNGLMIDLAVPAGAAAPVGRDDLAFHVSTAPGAGAWGAAAEPASVTVRPGAGVRGTDRVTVVWQDGAVRNDWLRVTVLANARTGLAAADVFYFGNLAGEVAGGFAGGAGMVVNALDLVAVRRSLFSTAPVTSAADVNRDGRVNALDVALVRANTLRTLEPFAPPPPPPPAAQARADAPPAATSLLRTDQVPGQSRGGP